MSKATNQTVVMLSVVAGCLVAIMDQKAFSRVDMQEQLDKAIMLTLTTADKWPRTGNETRNKFWRDSRFELWKHIVMVAPGSFKPPMLLAMADRVLTELTTRITNLDSLAKLEAISAHVKAFHDFVDPEGKNFEAYEDCGRLMDRLERLLEWND